MSISEEELHQEEEFTAQLIDKLSQQNEIIENEICDCFVSEQMRQEKVIKLEELKVWQQKWQDKQCESSLENENLMKQQSNSGDVYDLADRMEKISMLKREHNRIANNLMKCYEECININMRIIKNCTKH